MKDYQLNELVCTIEGNIIVPITYKDYLREYWANEVTSPNGIEPRLFVREIEDWDDDGRPTYRYELRSWGVTGSGSSTLIDEFETLEDAEFEMYQHWAWDCEEKSRNVPMCMWQSDAIAFIAEESGHSIEVVERLQNLVHVHRERRAREKEAAMQLREAKKAIQDAAIAAEAAEIEPDAELFAALHQAKDLKGEEKTKAISATQVAFLHRIGHYPIRTDFWKVFKIVNKKKLQFS